MLRGLGFAIVALVAGSFAVAQQSGEGTPPEEGPISSAMPVEIGAVSAEDFFGRDAYKLSPIICPFKGEVKYKPGEISCGLLTVPENRTTPTSRAIDLHYVKIAARKPKDWDEKGKGEWSKRDNPIIYLTGGPGAQATGYVKRLKDHGVRDFRDLYILEQRGIGYSQDFCPLYGLFDPSASNTPDFDEYLRAGLKAAEACFAAAQARGVDLSAYNTIENARDVKALRRALGFEQWNMWGISYGSFLGQQYLKEDPEGIRAAVIDAIAPLEPRARFHGVGRSYQRDLDLLEAACKADENCAAAFPNLIARYKDAIVAVRDGGPIEIDAIDSEYFPSGKAWLFHDLIGALPFVQLYEQKNFGSLPAFISALTTMVEKEDYSALRALTGSGGVGGASVSQGMY
ncbi:MAG: alpha/beta hydrolase, partial [Parvularculaceae bacterium]